MEKLIIMSNFYFYYNVFKSRLLQRRQNASVWQKGLINIRTMKTQVCLCIRYFTKRGSTIRKFTKRGSTIRNLSKRGSTIRKLSKRGSTIRNL